jgi:hypothetical protein
MMRLLKFLTRLILAFLAVGLTFGIIFFLTPSWQQSVVSDILAKDTERRWQVGEVNLSPFSVEAAGIYMLQTPIGAEIPHLELSGPVWQVPLTRRIVIDSGEISGLVLDVNQVRVGDTTSSDWQSFLDRVSGDPAFWEERIGLVLAKLSASGWSLDMENVVITGQVLMPGERVIPLRLLVIEADTDSPRDVKVQPLPVSQGAEL